MRFKVVLIAFELLFFIQASAANVTGVTSKRTEADFCTVCKSHEKPMNLPDLGGLADRDIEDIKRNIAILVKSKQGQNINGQEVIQIVLKPQLSVLENQLRNNLNIQFIDEVDKTYPQQMSQFTNDPKNQLHIPDAELERILSSRAVGFKYGTNADFENETGLSYDLLAGQQIFHFRGGAFIKGTLRQKISKNSEFTGDASIQDNGIRSLTFNYHLHFK